MRTNEQAKIEVEAAKKNAKRLCYTYENGAFPIELRQKKADNFTVIYGLQVKQGLSYNQAASELGSCIMHALACDDMLGNA